MRKTKPLICSRAFLVISPAVLLEYMTNGSQSVEENSMLVRIPLYDSLALDFGACNVTSAGLMPWPGLSAALRSNRGTGPRKGTLRCCLTSSGILMVLSRYSNKEG